MGEAGKKDKGKKEQRKKPKLTIKEKRKQKNEKKETVQSVQRMNRSAAVVIAYKFGKVSLPALCVGDGLTVS